MPKEFSRSSRVAEQVQRELAIILRRLAEQVGGELAAADHACFDDAAWVAWRLAELLPLELEERQQLLETGAPAQRLQLLAEWLPRFQRH